MQNYKKSKGVIHYLAFFYKSMDLTFYLLVQNHKLGSLTVALIKKSFNPLYSLCFLCQTFRFDI